MVEIHKSPELYSTQSNLTAKIQKSISPKPDGVRGRRQHLDDDSRVPSYLYLRLFVGAISDQAAPTNAFLGAVPDSTAPTNSFYFLNYKFYIFYIIKTQSNIKKLCICTNIIFCIILYMKKYIYKQL